ncbi:MAG: hypothetical protein IKN00_04280 [Bacteroidales bacterium]|nr:hypothetical protein [Bacteroidales bacterium]
MTITMERHRLMDASGTRYTIEIIRTRGRYEIRMNGEFCADASTIADAEDEVFDIAKRKRLM